MQFGKEKNRIELTEIYEEGDYRMDWEISHLIEQVSLDEKEDDHITLICRVPTAAEHFRKLLVDATQASLDFDAGEWDGKAVIGFRLKNANGEFYLALKKEDWEHLEEQPDELTFVYGEGEKERFSVPFLNRMFDSFLDNVIAKYNEGNKEPVVQDIVAVFAEED